MLRTWTSSPPLLDKVKVAAATTEASRWQMEVLLARLPGYLLSLDEQTRVIQ
jgi:hypothetical protein